MASTKSKTSTQVRKTISFSKKRDKILLDFVDDHDDDFSYNAKQLMLDGLRFRQMLEQNQQTQQSQLLQALPVQNVSVATEKEEKPVEDNLIDREEKVEANWNELDDIELEEAETDVEELEKKLDNF